VCEEPQRPLRLAKLQKQISDTKATGKEKRWSDKRLAKALGDLEDRAANLSNTITKFKQGLMALPFSYTLSDPNVIYKH
jgi:hypothetical protein